MKTSTKTVKKSQIERQKMRDKKNKQISERFIKDLIGNFIINQGILYKLFY